MHDIDILVSYYPNNISRPQFLTIGFLFQQQVRSLDFLHGVDMSPNEL